MLFIKQIYSPYYAQANPICLAAACVSSQTPPAGSSNLKRGKTPFPKISSQNHEQGTGKQKQKKKKMVASQGSVSELFCQVYNRH